jgi:type VI secretion system protein ImpG
MTDELLDYYNRELAYIRHLGAEFAQANPKIAGRLRITGDSAEDPHVSRMIEGFAFLAARVRRKIDDEFPEICESLLNILYPHYLAPFPSAAIVQGKLNRSQMELTSGYSIPRGSPIETEMAGQPCRFRTCYDVRLWPLEIVSAMFQAKPFTAPSTSASPQAHAVVRISLRTFSDKVTVDRLALDGIRFFLKGQDQYIYDLYEVLMNNTLQVVVATAANDREMIVLDRAAVRPVGFERDQGLVDYSARSFLGYRLLTEYFAFPKKFLFFELQGLTAQRMGTLKKANTLELFFYVDRTIPQLEQNVGNDTFQLGCTPIINQYRQRAEPIRWTHTETEYRIIPDVRRPKGHEIYSIDRVIGTSPDGREVEFLPFYGVSHGRANADSTYWHATRRAAGYAEGQIDFGTEMFLSLVDLDFSPSRVADSTIDVETTCLNRDLPASLQFGGGPPRLQLTSGSPLASLECVTLPTPTRRPALRHQTIWKLISHLSLNYLSLIDTDGGAAALREILSLYVPFHSTEAGKIIQGVTHVSARRIVGRVTGGAAAGFCRGVEVTLDLDEDNFSGSGLYLFSAVMERFLALYSGLNSFSKTVVRSNRRQGLVCQWPPRAGESVLL